MFYAQIPLCVVILICAEEPFRALVSGRKMIFADKERNLCVRAPGKGTINADSESDGMARTKKTSMAMTVRRANKAVLCFMRTGRLDSIVTGAVINSA